VSAARDTKNPPTAPRRNARARRAAAHAGAMARKGDALMPLTLTRHGDVAVLVLDRQEALNALSFACLEEIGDAFDAVRKIRARALVITGAGTKAFCAGADVKELRGRELAAQKR